MTTSWRVTDSLKSLLKSTINYLKPPPLHPPVLDMRGIPTHACPKCGDNDFLIRVSFDDYQIATYFTTGTCYGCGTVLTVPTELDRPKVDL